MPEITITQEDNMKLMARYPDGYFDLAIVDPPFGIGQNWTKDRKGKFYGHRNDFNNSTPTSSYFKELFRVSKNQIIWGANYYWNYLTPSNNLIFWDKGKDAERQFGSAGELAWTSMSKFPLIKVSLLWNGCVVCEINSRIHPHQKPVKLYKWLLNKFAQPGDKILDTHLGSGSIAIACHDYGFDLTACELDETYFNGAMLRLKQHQSQLTLI